MIAPRQTISEAELAALKAANPCDQVAGKWVRLRKHGKKLIGPCPLHSPDPSARDSTAFECDADGFVCAVCCEGGDVIKLVQLREKLDFLAAVNWLGGVQKLDPEKEAQLEAQREQKRTQSEKSTAEFRERERGKVFDIWKRGVAIVGTPVEDYLILRGVTAPPGVKLRAILDMPYYASGAKDAEAIHRGPAMLAPIMRGGKFSGLHITYIDLAQPKGKLSIFSTDEKGEKIDMSAKKVRGSKTGGHIELIGCENPRRLIIGEGIEKVLAVWRALYFLAEKQRDASEAEPLKCSTFWTSVDLGNLGGKAAGTVPHPTLKNAGGKMAQRVPGPDPDLEAPGIAIPDSVQEIIILGDATSDRFSTECAIARASKRWARDGRSIKVAWGWVEADFDDVLRTEQPIEAARARVVAAIEQAQPVTAPAVVEQQAEQTKPRRQARPNLRLVSSSPPVAASAASLSAADNLSEQSEPSQTGASTASNRQLEEARGGGGNGNDGGDDLDELNRRLAFFPQTDLGNAERFVERHKGALMFCDELGWLWWDGRRWAREGADGQVRKAEHVTVRAIQIEAKALKASGKDSVVDEKKGTTMSDVLAGWGRKSEANSKIVSIAKNAAAYLAVKTDALDADPFAINVKNGTLVVRRTWSNGMGVLAAGWQRINDYIRLKPHDPSDRITKLAPVDYDPHAERVQFDRFIVEVQPDEKMRKFLQQWKGYSITADASEHCMALFIGQGRNGKSVFEDATAHVAGDYAETVPIETFLASGREMNANSPTPARALLHGARMVRTSEPNKGVAFDEGFIKLVTGGDPIQARNLNLPMFRFYPVLKLTVSGNHRPKISGTDEGIWSRVKLVPWDVIIPPEQRDRALTEKLRREGSGILNWMLDGLSEWIEHGLVYPEPVITATAEYRRDSDQLGRFLEVCVVPDADGRAQSSVLLGVHNAWARANGLTEWKGRGFSAAMTDRGFKKDKSSAMFWLGIRLIKSESDFGDLGGRMGAGSHSGAAGRSREDPMSEKIEF